MPNDKRADILLAHIQGKQIQMFLTLEAVEDIKNLKHIDLYTWVDVTPENVKLNLTWCSNSVEFRVKPETKMKHEHADILSAIAKGKRIQIKSKECAVWVTVSPEEVLALINKGCLNHEIRVKPKTLSLNGMEFPKPLKRLLFGQRYYTLDCATVEEFIYEGGRQDCAALEAGLAFATEEDCEAFLSALKSVLRP